MTIRGEVSTPVHHQTTACAHAGRRGARPAFEQLLEAMQAVNEGNFAVQLPVHWEGTAIAGKLNDSTTSFRTTAGLPRIDACNVESRPQGRTRQRLAAANIEGA